MTVYRIKYSATGDDDGSTWEDAFPTIQEFIAVAVSGDEGWVARGSYYTDGSGIVIPEGVSLYGGFSKQLSGTDGTVAGRTEGVMSRIRGQGSYPGIIISNNTITVDGFDLSDCTDDDGAGICIEADGSNKYYGPELLTDGDMEAAGTSAWTSGDGASLSKGTSVVYEGSQSLNVQNENGYAYQIVTSSSVTYRATGYAYDADGSPIFKSGTTTVWTHSGGTQWEAFDEEFVASSNYIALFTPTGEVTPTTIWDDVSVRRVYTGYIGDITINNCRVRYCTATDDGAGIYVHNAIDVTITDVEIDHNTASSDGGGICITTGSYTDVTMEDLYVHDNECGGAGGGGGAYVGSPSEIKNSIFNDNDANYGGNIYSVSGLTLTNCVLHGGTVDDPDYGAGIACDGTNTLTNCTVVVNTGDGIVAWSGTTTVVNCIFWGNDVEINPDGGTINVTYSNVEGGYAGTGNVTGEPVFVGEGRHEYALAAICDAVDSANAGATYYETTDLRGSARFDHPSVTDTGVGTPTYSDMGAYEFQGTPIHTMPMSLYYLDQSADGGTTPYYMYAILRLPEMPYQFGGGTPFGPTGVRHKIQSEVYSDDADSTLVEYVYIGSGSHQHMAAYRQVSAAVTPPSRAIDYQTDFQDDSDSTIAVEPQFPGPQTFEGKMPNVGQHYWYVIAEMQWIPDHDTGSSIKVYNVDFRQWHNDDYPYEDFDAGLRPGTGRVAPDVPLSAGDMQALQDALLKILYEAVTDISVPVFGQHTIPVV